MKIKIKNKIDKLINNTNLKDKINEFNDISPYDMPIILSIFMDYYKKESIKIKKKHQREAIKYGVSCLLNNHTNIYEIMLDFSINLLLFNFKEKKYIEEGVYSNYLEYKQRTKINISFC